MHGQPAAAVFRPLFQQEYPERSAWVTLCDNATRLSVTPHYDIDSVIVAYESPKCAATCTVQEPGHDVAVHAVWNADRGMRLAVSTTFARLPQYSVELTFARAPLIARGLGARNSDPIAE